jgi:hypothetical protein
VKRVLALVVACGGSTEPPSAAVAPPPVAAAGSESAVPEPPPPAPRGWHASVRRPGPANDDLPHRRAAIAPWLDHADTCIPPRDALLRGQPEHGLPGDDDLTLSLDAYADHLVTCAQLQTRRGNSVFFDRVSFACWDVDPARGTLTRRADLGRSYLDCQDGRCEPAAATWPSYDGSEVVIRDDDRRVFDVFARGSNGARGKKLRTVAEPADPVGEPPAVVADLRGVLFVSLEDRVLAIDARGSAFATAGGLVASVVDPTTVRIVTDALHALDVDVVTHRETVIQLPGCEDNEFGASSPDPTGPCVTVLAATHLVGAIRYHGTLYATDDNGRRLDVLDPATYRATAARALAVCPPP